MSKAQFFEACGRGDLEAAQATVSDLSHIDDFCHKGWNGLIRACHGGHHEMARWLIAQGADVNAKNSKGTTVFMYAKTAAASNGDFELLDYLIECGADYNAVDIFGKTALDYVLEVYPNNPLIAYLENLNKRK